MDLFLMRHQEEKLSVTNGYPARRKGLPPTPTPSPPGGGGLKRRAGVTRLQPFTKPSLALTKMCACSSSRGEGGLRQKESAFLLLASLVNAGRKWGQTFTQTKIPRKDLPGDLNF